jgi:hypothetical protein
LFHFSSVRCIVSIKLLAFQNWSNTMIDSTVRFWCESNCINFIF